MRLTIKSSDIRKAINEVISSQKAQKLIKEAMYRNMPGEGEDFPPFSGRKPKTVKARINQIYSLVNKYGLSSRKYTDDHWQATNDYDRILTHLGYEVQWEVKDGGYGDYRDGRPMSKTYDITLIAEDGMEIGGYIKCMAAGSVEDPFDAYDTCMVLWNKPKRRYDEQVISRVVKESVNRILLERDVDGDDETFYEDSKYKTSEITGIYDLTTDSVFKWEEDLEIDPSTDEHGGVHKFVFFYAEPCYEVISDDGDWWTPPSEEIRIDDYDLYVDKVSHTTIVEDGYAYYDDDEESKEPFGGLTDEQMKKVRAFLDSLTLEDWKFEPTY